MCQTAVRHLISLPPTLLPWQDWNSWFLLFPPHKVLSCVPISLAFKRSNLFSWKTRLILRSHLYVLQALHEPTSDWILVFRFKIFERILFIWAIRHPASGYVQGINDLVTPFFVVYVFEYIGKHLLLCFVCDGLPMWQFAFCLNARVASNRAFLHPARLQGGGGSRQQVSENGPRDPVRLCCLSSRFSLPFCSHPCFFHLSSLISVRSGAFRLVLCLIVLWNTIYQKLWLDCDGRACRCTDPLPGLPADVQPHFLIYFLN